MNSVVFEKSKKFAVRIVGLYQYLNQEKKRIHYGQTDSPMWNKHRREYRGSTVWDYPEGFCK